MGGDVAIAYEVASELIKLAKKQGWLDRLLNVFRKQHKILLLGSTGVGKTNMLQSLTELIPEAIDYMSRTEFAKKHRVKVSRQPFIFIDTPGQALHAPRRSEEIRNAMKDGIDGVINVVCYGYHEYRQASGNAIKKSNKVREPYLEQHRQIEIDALDEWTFLLGDRTVTNWLITVITKADLWWNQKDEVFQYYEKGPYYDALGEAIKLNPVFIEYCSVFHKFYGRGPLAGSFDETDRARTKAHLLRILLEAIGKSGPNG